MSEINQLFNSLLHSKLVEVFSWGHFFLISFMFCIALLFFNLYIIIALAVTDRTFTKRFLTCWLTISVLLSLVTTFAFGRTTDTLSQKCEPIKYEYNATAIKSAKQSLSKIANDFPYVLTLNNSDSFKEANTQYFVFSSSSNEIKKLDNQFESNGPSQLVFLQTNSNTVVIKVDFSENMGTLANYKIVKNVGLPSDEWKTNFINTNQLQVKDLRQ